MRTSDWSYSTWRKSSHSGSQADDCIEVASAWHKSSHSGSQAGDCLEVAAAWRKSSHSGSQGADCVELAEFDRAVAVRDSKDPDGPVLAFAPDAWSAFLTTLKEGAGG